MKHLGKTIDKILKVEPALGSRLMDIKEKWEKSPTHNTFYWRRLLKVLNDEIVPQHPKRIEIQNLLLPKRKIQRNLYTFEPPTPVEKLIGRIPEGLEGKLRKYDKTQIDLAKKTLESRMTRNPELMLAMLRKAELMDIEQRKLWSQLKDHFKLWDVEPKTYLIRQQEGALILTTVGSQETPVTPATTPVAPPPPTGEPMPETFIIRMDPDILKKFFKYFNITPPPGMFQDGQF